MRVLVFTAAMLAGIGGSTAQSLCNTHPQTNVRLGVNSDNTPYFLLNGQPWLPHGLQIRGFVASLSTAQALGDDATVNAQRAYNKTELNAAISMFNADMLRIQVSQGDLDPQYTPPGNPPAGYKAAYRNTVMQAIKLARNNCFVVIVSMQAESRSGVKVRSSISDESTRRAWTYLLSGNDGATLTGDQGVMLEIYNEPDGMATDDNWSRWAHAGDGTQYGNATDPNTGAKLYGMQPMINYMRKSVSNGGLGSTNVLIVDGLVSAHTFTGVDSLKNYLIDPLAGTHSQIAYAVHPYLDIVTDENPDNPQYEYAPKWGFLHKAGSNGRPPAVVFISEWSAQEGNGTGLGLGTPPDLYEVLKLLNYMITNEVPMNAGAFDVPKFMSQEIPVGNKPPVRGFWVPTNYDNYNQNKCAQSGNNAGLFIKTMFETGYSRQLVESDGKTKNQDTMLWC